ncbi:hypothetical protein N7462_010426 [Penicillium macrosclerotiorum]|uniref:uncharacterized protein n=1 Tax=Penicillium macrosclerotiorum TaxID=303699 RepID=UPI00254731EC|nr:uncharacterized protein N7462_010426 [Penicillium macrosclerotiorum]KAJ5669356.1 hypothetical protein N7462_010426 [Penicillium macrosclerotiorum]
MGQPRRLAIDPWAVLGIGENEGKLEAKEVISAYKKRENDLQGDLEAGAYKSRQKRYDFDLDILKASKNVLLASNQRTFRAHWEKVMEGKSDALQGLSKAVISDFNKLFPAQRPPFPIRYKDPPREGAVGSESPAGDMNPLDAKSRDRERRRKEEGTTYSQANPAGAHYDARPPEPKEPPSAPPPEEPPRQPGDFPPGKKVVKVSIIEEGDKHRVRRWYGEGEKEYVSDSVDKIEKGLEEDEDGDLVVIKRYLSRKRKDTGRRVTLVEKEAAFTLTRIEGDREKEILRKAKVIGTIMVGRDSVPYSQVLLPRDRSGKPFNKEKVVNPETRETKITYSWELDHNILYQFQKIRSEKNDRHEAPPSGNPASASPTS